MRCAYTPCAGVGLPNSAMRVVHLGRSRPSDFHDLVLANCIVSPNLGSQSLKAMDAVEDAAIHANSFVGCCEMFSNGEICTVKSAATTRCSRDDVPEIIHRLISLISHVIRYSSTDSK
jgi:hypothetical protein